MIQVNLIQKVINDINVTGHILNPGILINENYKKKNSPFSKIPNIINRWISFFILGIIFYFIISFIWIKFT